MISPESRRHPPGGPAANKKGKFVVRGKIRFKNRKKKGQSSNVFQGKKSGDNVFPAPSRRRGKKSDDNDHSHHVSHQHLSDEEQEEVIFQDPGPGSSFSSDLTRSNRRPQNIREKTDSIQIQAASTNNKKSSRPVENSAPMPVTEVHRVQDSHIHHTMMMSVTRSSGPSTGDCLTSTGATCGHRLRLSEILHVP